MASKTEATECVNELWNIEAVIQKRHRVVFETNKTTKAWDSGFSTLRRCVAVVAADAKAGTFAPIATPLY
jgi:hypothetical protein